jgi:hypothetical protein
MHAGGEGAAPRLPLCGIPAASWSRQMTMRVLVKVWGVAPSIRPLRCPQHRDTECAIRSDGGPDFPPPSLRPTPGRAGRGGTVRDAG